MDNVQPLVHYHKIYKNAVIRTEVNGGKNPLKNKLSNKTNTAAIIFQYKYLDIKYWRDLIIAYYLYTILKLLLRKLVHYNVQNN